MGRQFQHAVYNLTVSAIALIGFLLLLPQLGNAKAQVAFAVLGFLGLGPLFYRRGRGTDIVLDERDVAINARATMIASAGMWLVTLLCCMVPWWMNFRRGVVAVEVLPAIVWVSWASFTLLHASATLAQYRLHRTA